MGLLFSPKQTMALAKASVKSLFANVDDYFFMQQNFYEKTSALIVRDDHYIHNNNTQAPNLGFGALLTEPHKFVGSSALDFGCGGGRNMLNLASFKLFSRIDGVDISEINIRAAHSKFKQVYPNIESNTYQNSLEDLGVPSHILYKFVFSTITLQHISSWQLRQKIFTSIFRSMESGGLFSFQMGYNSVNLARGWKFPANKYRVRYEKNLFGAPSTNGKYDVSVSHPSQLLKDLTKVGFEQIEWVISPSFANQTHCAWIWIKARKPELSA